MKLTKLIAAFALLSLAACEGYKLPSDNPVDDHKILILGQEISRSSDGQLDGQLRKQLASFGNVEGLDRGYSSLFIRALLDGGFDSRTDMAAFKAMAGSSRCREAKVDKINFHTRDGSELPLAFGKIIEIEVDQFQNPYWAGYIDLCTWIKNGSTYDEYLFHIDFEGVKGDTKTLTSVARDKNAVLPNLPFPGTLEPDSAVDKQALFDMMKVWDFKIHAKKSGVKYTNIWRNGVLLDQNDPAYDNDQECFDMFLNASGHASLVNDSTLPDQNGYCMGRCDAIVLNTK